MCSRLGFYHKIDHYAFVITAGLAAYEINDNGDKELGNNMLDILPDKVELSDVNDRIYDIKSAMKGSNSAKTTYTITQ